MRQNRISMGLAALLALFFLSSCITKDPTLGSELVPSNQDITIRTVVLDLPVNPQNGRCLFRV